MKTLMKILIKDTEKAENSIKFLLKISKDTESMSYREKRNAQNIINNSLDAELDSYINRFIEVLTDRYPIFMQEWSIQTAAQKHHDVGRGGLKNHSIRLTKTLIKNVINMTQKVPDIFTLVFAGITHDFCKVYHYYEMDTNEYGIYDVAIKHHSKLSVDILEQNLQIKLSPAARALILLHMSGFQNQEDMKALTIRERIWLMNLENLRILQLFNNADCR